MLLAAPLLGLAVPVPAWKRWLAPSASLLWPTLTLPNGLDPSLATNDPEGVRRFREEPLIHHVATVRWFCELRRATRWLAEQPARLEVPTLMMLAGDERVVDNFSSRAFAHGAAGRVEVRTTAGARHEMFWGTSATETIEEAVAWLAAATTGAPGDSTR
jgi:lysophospholipase